jgi:hypothetical protein
MVKKKASPRTGSKAAKPHPSTARAPLEPAARRYFNDAIAALLVAMDQVADAIDALPLDDSQRGRLVQLQRATKAPLDAVLADDADELTCLATMALKSIRALESRHRERFNVEDCPAPCVPLDRYGFAGRVQALGDSVIGNQPTTLQNADRILATIRAMNEQEGVNGDDFAVMFPWIAINLHEGKVSAGQGPLLPTHVANRPAASHLPRSKGGKQRARWPEHDRLKLHFELWKSAFDGAKLSDAAYHRLIVGGLKELGADDVASNGLFKGLAMRRSRAKRAETRQAKLPSARFG